MLPPVTRRTLAVALLAATTACARTPDGSAQTVPDAAGAILATLLAAPAPPDLAPTPAVAPATRTARRPAMAALP
ncbi:hypothetical protein [Azospirillum canadense]|uniref:hypothetical protein n=1 Tax=Azospirillum canadense TaxID=403962 RepID=UPI002227FF59|nr:hypothetical protein [Azospirillum canadense]MCW2240772.1 hypothetical protein [Azospirillum canadense]